MILSDSTRFSSIHPLKHSHFLPIRVDNTNYEDATNRILTWAIYGEKRYVCVANVHMVMEAHKDECFRKIVNKSDLVTPDGMPLVWTMRLLGTKNQTRVYGPTLMSHVCKAASKYDLPVGFYGGSPETIKYLVTKYIQTVCPLFELLTLTALRLDRLDRKKTKQWFKT